MPEWINAKYRLPVMFGRYFVKIDGYKEMLTLQEIELKENRGYEVLWLDDSDSPKQNIKPLNGGKHKTGPKPKQFVSVDRPLSKITNQGKRKPGRPRKEDEIPANAVEAFKIGKRLNTDQLNYLDQLLK